jgi:hypothetical protein
MQGCKDYADNVCGLGDIVVVDWKPYEKGYLRGFLDISLARTLRLNGLKLFEKEGRRWINWPSKEYSKKDGSKGYAPVVEFDSEEIERAHNTAVVSALDRYFKENANG